MHINLSVAFKPASFIQKGGKNCFGMKKQPFILEKGCSFLLADIGIFIDFLVLEKKKTKMCSVDSCRFSIFKKDEEKQSKKFDFPIHQIQKFKKRPDSFRVC